MAAALGLVSAVPSHSAIVLTQTPVGMRKQSAEITVGWAGGAGRVHLRASTVPGGAGAPIAHYDSLHLPSQLESGAYTFKVNPDIPVAYRNTDLRYGINYCVVTDGKTASPEFAIILESSNAPVLTAPANAASIKELTPTFAWTGDAPYYAVLVSDEPFKIGDDGTVSGVSAIWQIITPYASARYGEADPSGNSSASAPPLISGKTYNWLVLNNYGNNSASTSKVAPVPASFTYLPAPPLASATLIEPKDKDTLPAPDRIVFRWGLVDGAVSYKLELLEENLVDGSQADVSLWKATSTDGQIALDNAGGMLRRYNYKWRVYAVGNNGSASISAKRSFFYAAEVGDINVFVKDQSGLKVAYVPVKINRLGASSSSVYQGGSTDNEGSLSIKNAPLGTYEIRIENADGYQSRIDTLNHAAKTGDTRNIVLTPVLGKLTGRVAAAATGNGILNAKIIATGGDGSQWADATNSQGYYSLGLPYGSWQVKAQADGYAPAGAISVSLSASANSRTADFALASNPYNLSGTVRNSYNLQGIFGATVQLSLAGQTRSANTDGNGAFSFSVPAGTASVRVSSPGFASPEPAAVVVDGDKTLSLSLDPNASILSGRTRDLSGTGIPGATVKATPKAGPARTAVSDNQGFFEISLPAGDWLLGGAANGYTSQTTRKFLLDVSKTVQGVDFSFAPNQSRLAGRVTVNGAGLAGATVTSADASAATDNAGYYRLSVTAGVRNVSASKDGYLIPKVWSVPVNPGDTVANLDFAASGNAGLAKGRVVSGGAGVAAARVQALNKATREAFSQATDGTGAYALSLPGGIYDFTASKEGFALEGTLSVNLPAGGTILGQDLRLLSDQGNISGNVASGNAALYGCEVAYRNGSDPTLAGKTMTDPQGRYTLSLQAGSAYALTAACGGYQQAAITTSILARGASLTQDFNLAAAGAAWNGKVLDASGKAVAGAKVSAEKGGEAVTALTDFNGAYAFGLGAGSYTLAIAKTGYRSVSRPFNLALGEKASATDTLRASVGRLAGRVTSDGAPVPGALLTLSGQASDAGGIFLTDADGRYSRDDMPSGTYSLAAAAEGFADGRIASLTIAEGQFTSVDLSLASNRSALEGKVTADGAAVANATVAATAYGVARSTVTGADGKYRLDKLPAGSYAVSANLAGYSADKAYEGKALAAAATLSGLDFALSRNVGSLSGAVSGAADAAGIQVAAVGAKKGARGYAACDAAGKYAIPSLPADDYTVTVSAPGYKVASGPQAASMTVAGAQKFDIALAPAVFRLAGTIADQAGGGIAGLPLELKAGASAYRTVTASDGTYGFPEVPAGQEYLLACKPPTADFDPEDSAFSLPLDAPATYTLNLRTLSRQANVSGTVSLDGTPAEGVLIRAAGNGNAITTLSQPGGAFKVPGIAGSTQPLSLSFSKAGAGGFDTAITVNVGKALGLAEIKLKTLKLSLTASLANSEGKILAGAKVVAGIGKRLDTLIAGTDGKVKLADIPANQGITLATALAASDYDNLETSIFLKEKDTAVVLQPKVHATRVTVKAQDQAGTAVDGAAVTLNGKNLGNTSQGRIVATGLGRGSYQFIAGKSGYKSGPALALDVSGDTAAEITLTLSKVSGGVYGTIRDSGLVGTSSGAKAVAASRTLPSAIVILVAGTDTLRDTANGLGQYALEGLAEGRKYAIGVSLPGYRLLTDSIMGTVQAQERDLTLRPIPGTLLGRVEGGQAGVKISLADPAGGGSQAFHTRYGGYYAFTGLRNHGDYLAQAFEGANSSPAEPFQADGGAAKRFDPVLEARGGAQGKVLGSSGNPASGALVKARNILTGALTLGVADSTGRYTLAGLAGGKYELGAEGAGYRASPPVELSIAAGTVASQDFRLEESVAGIGGWVSDTAGNGLTATVFLAKGTDTLMTRTDGSGQFAFGGLTEGAYSLRAEKEGYASGPGTAIAYGGKGLETRTLALARISHLVSGTVRDALTNAPLAGVAVQAAGGAAAVSDSLGRYQAIPPAGASQISLSAALDGYLTRSDLPIYLDADGSANQDLLLTADYKFDGRINVSVKEGADLIPDLFITLRSFHPGDSSAFSVSATVPSSFRELRRPVPYTVKVKREGFKDLTKVVELTAKVPTLDLVMAYPTSRIRLFITADGKHGKSSDLSLDGQRLGESPDTAGLYESGAKLKTGRYEAAIRETEANLIPLSSYFIDLGEDSVRTDTLSRPFFSVPIADTVIDAPFVARVIRVDSLRPAPAVACSLYYRLKGEPLWSVLALDSVAGGFADTVPPLPRAGAYEYYFSLRSPSGARIGTVSGGSASLSTGPLAYTGIQSPSGFVLRDPYLLQSFALAPQRLEADTSLYTLGARDLFQAQMRGENGRSLDAYFDRLAGVGAAGFTVEWSFADPARAKAAGLSLEQIPSYPRYIRFDGGSRASDSVFRIDATARMGDVRLKKSFFVKIQDLAAAAIGIRYVKENRALEEDGAALPLPNRNPAGYAFAAFARTAEGRVFNILPHWSLGEDSAAGELTQQGIFIPDSAVARSAVLRILDTLPIGVNSKGEMLYSVFQAAAGLTTLAQVSPASTGRTVVTNGEGASLDFNLAGLAKAFTVSVKKPQVSGLLRSSPKEEVVGDILDIELSERQPFKADSGATLKLPVASGIARKRTVYLGHWNTGRLAWEKVDSVSASGDVSGQVYSFSKYAVLMGSLPLGAYDFSLAPNPFSADDPWGLQLAYKVSSDVSSQVGVRVEVFNMMGDKVYETQETQLGKGDAVVPGTVKAAPQSSERRAALGPFVWDGRDTRGVPCRNGRYLLKLIVKDGKGSKEYLRKVVMLK